MIHPHPGNTRQGGWSIVEQGITLGKLRGSAYLWRFTPDEVEAAVGRMLGDGRATEDGQPGKERLLFHGPSLEALAREALEKLRAQADDDPLDPYLSLGELRRDLTGGKDWPALETVLIRLQAEGQVLRNEHGYRWAGQDSSYAPAQTQEAERLLAEFMTPGGASVETNSAATSPAETPSLAQAAASAGLDLRQAQKMAQALVREGKLVKVGEDLYYPPDRIDWLTSVLVEAFREHGQLSLAEVRNLLGTSRKFAQALLEYMDNRGLTLRVGDVRRLRRRRE